MYLVLTESPVLVDGGRLWLEPATKRALTLLRDALEGHLGPITVLAPSQRRDTAPHADDGVAPDDLEVVGRDEGLRVIPSVELRAAPGAFWLRDRRRWRADVEAWTRRARAVQADLNDVRRPLAFDGFREARRQDRPTVVVLGDDPARRRDAAARQVGPLARVGAQVLGALFDGGARYATRTADLALLRAGAPYRRFAEHAGNPRAFFDTSFREAEIVDAARLEERLRARAATPGAPLRVACAGRVDRHLGVDDAIDALRLARQRGTPAVLDIVDAGDDRRRLECRVASLGLRSVVRFVDAAHHPRRTGPQRLEDHDVLVFTGDRLAEPRPIFDGFAAGLPSVGYGHDELRQRAEEDGAAVPVRVGDVDAVARALVELARDAERLAQLSRAAHRAARFHSADAWARRRAAWILEVVEHREADARAGRKLAA